MHEVNAHTLHLIRQKLKWLHVYYTLNLHYRSQFYSLLQMYIILNSGNLRVTRASRSNTNVGLRMIYVD